MLRESCFDPLLILLDVPAATVEDAVRLAADAVAAHTGLERAAIFEPLQRGLTQDSAVPVGNGVALPHAGIVGLERPLVAVVRTAQGFDLHAGDKVPVDLFFMPLVPKGRAQLHLNVLAHMARLLRSQVLLKGLRESTTAEAAMGLIQATEARLAAAAPNVGDPVPQSQHDMVFVELTGEKAVDRLLVDLVEEGFEDAVVADAQHLREVMAESLPLFAGFRTLFDDPGGCRVFIVSCAVGRTETLMRIVKQACEQGQSEFARVMVLPVRTLWTWEPKRETASGGH